MIVMFSDPAIIQRSRLHLKRPPAPLPITPARELALCWERTLPATPSDAMRALLRFLADALGPSHDQGRAQGTS